MRMLPAVESFSYQKSFKERALKPLYCHTFCRYGLAGVAGRRDHGGRTLDLLSRWLEGEIMCLLSLQMEEFVDGMLHP